MPTKRIALSAAEEMSGLDRVRHAEALVSQLPEQHDGRNTWLLNYGVGKEAEAMRHAKLLHWDEETRSAALADGPLVKKSDRKGDDALDKSPDGQAVDTRTPRGGFGYSRTIEGFSDRIRFLRMGLLSDGYSHSLAGGFERFYSPGSSCLDLQANVATYQRTTGAIGIDLSEAEVARYIALGEKECKALEVGQADKGMSRRRVGITLEDLHAARDYSKQSSENYIGKPAHESAMVHGMARRLGLLRAEIIDAVPGEKSETYRGPRSAMETETKEAVDSPAHYGGKDNPYECIRVLEAWGLDEDFCLGNAVKYLSRAGKKNGNSAEQDISKAVWYLTRKLANLGKPLHTPAHKGRR